MVSKGNHPQMAQHFRLVKYYNLPRYLLTCGTNWLAGWEGFPGIWDETIAATLSAWRRTFHWNALKRVYIYLVGGMVYHRFNTISTMLMNIESRSPAQHEYLHERSWTVFKTLMVDGYREVIPKICLDYHDSFWEICSYQTSFWREDGLSKPINILI